MPPPGRRQRLAGIQLARLRAGGPVGERAAGIAGRSGEAGAVAGARGGDAAYEGELWRSDEGVTFHKYGRMRSRMPCARGHASPASGVDALSMTGDAITRFALTSRACPTPGRVAVATLLLCFALPVVVTWASPARAAYRVDPRVLIPAASVVQVAACAGLALAQSLAATMPWSSSRSRLRRRQPTWNSVLLCEPSGRPDRARSSRCSRR